MRRKWKKAAALLCAGVLAFSMAGCGNSSGSTQSSQEEGSSAEVQESAGGQTQEASETAAASDTGDHEPVTITVWRCNMTDERTALCEELNQKFMEEYPWITVEFTSLPDSFNEKLEVSFEAGNAPDVFFNNGNVIAYARNGYIIPLDDLYEDWDDKDLLL